jgi:hypothetical protein
MAIGLLLCTAACVEPYKPEIRETQDLLVVNGIITDRPGIHYVEVSRSSPYNQPAFIPVAGCVVRVEDDGGEGVTYTEYRPGRYGAYLDSPFLGLSRSYKLFVFTPDGKQYQSEYDQLLACPLLDRLYYEVSHQETEDPGKYYYGLQFYVDVKPETGASRNVLWKLEETYEYHSPYLIQYIWDGRTLLEFSPPTDSLYTCYKTRAVRELYAASTKYLVTNELNKYPLNYVSNQTSRLLIKYSLLVSQYSLSDEAFIYWERIKKQMNETGGLYETQPAGSKGNIFNADDPGEQVLGYFYASQVREERILIRNTFDFAIPRYTCQLDTANSIGDLGNHFFYMIALDPMSAVGPPYGYADLSCFDCTLLGGTTQMPEYWK